MFVPELRIMKTIRIQDIGCKIQDSQLGKVYTYHASCIMNRVPFYFNFSSLILISWFGLFLVIHLLGLPNDKVLEHLPIFCPFKALTGILCPGCGMTRALLALAEFDFVRALRFNPFSLPLFAFFVFSAFKIQLPIPQRINNYLPIFILFIILIWWFWTRLVPGVFI